MTNSSYNQLIKRINAYDNPIRLYKTHDMTKLYHDIFAATSFLPISAKIKERIYVINSNIVTLQTCKQCGINTVKFQGPTLGYREFCSVKCRANNLDWQATRASTCVDRYGVEYPAQHSNIKEQVTATLFDKYGINITSTQQIPSVYEKTKISNIAKYGTYHSNHRHMSTETVSLLHDADWLIKQHITNSRSVHDIALSLGVADGCVLRHMDIHKIQPIKHPGVPSIGQQQLTEFIKQCIPTDELIISDISTIHPKHLDILVPSKRIAFEYNGLYWHSEAVRPDKNYHLNKTKLCEEANIKLIHIFENEWFNKQEIVQSRVRSILGTTTKIYARLCTIGVLSTKAANQFINMTHIQGANNSATVAIGLWYNNELISVVTFCKSRYDKEYQYELLRMCTALNTTVVGGASKILQFFIKNFKPISLVSYCDRRWSNGNGYVKMEFQLVDTTTPNYWYFKNGSSQLMSRVKFQKHKLKDILPIFDSSLTEFENMKNNGDNRIWDCGQLKFSYDCLNRTEV